MGKAGVKGFLDPPGVMRICRFESEAFHELPYWAGPLGGGPALRLPFHRAAVEGLPDGLAAIVVTSDLQGVVCARTGTAVPLGEAVGEQLNLLQERGALPTPERTATLLAGDLHPRAGEADVCGIWKAIRKSCRWIAGVGGNHDVFGTEPMAAGVLGALERERCWVLDEQIVTVDRMRIGGICGAVGDGHGTWERPESAFAKAVERLAQQRPDMLVMHDGPNVAGTAFAGWPSIRRAVEGAPPTLVIRGHDHWDSPLQLLVNGTQVLNVEGRVVVLERM